MSRPSSITWIATRGTPSRSRGRSGRGGGCRSRARRPCRSARPGAACRRSSSPGGRRRRRPGWRRSFRRRSPAEMRTRSCFTTRPAPRLRWPTSLLPIWPPGSPTASPDASSRVRGARAHSRSQVGTLRHRDRVAFALGAVSPAVQDDEHDGCGALGHSGTDALGVVMGAGGIGKCNGGGGEGRWESVIGYRLSVPAGSETRTMVGAEDWNVRGSFFPSCSISRAVDGSPRLRASA